MSDMKEQLHLFIQGDQLYITGAIGSVSTIPFEGQFGVATDAGHLISIERDRETARWTFRKVALSKDYKIVDQVNSCKIYSVRSPKWIMTGIYTTEE